jgi:glutathione synthase/RimK-type ligase-like ATP-grasp enzyme
VSRRIAFITFDQLPELDPDDRLAADELAARGVDVVPAIWDDPHVDWTGFDVAIVRSAWDYHLKLPAFLTWLAARESEGLTLWNSADTIRWNLDKKYLLRLEREGVAIIPTLLIGAGQACDLAGLMDERGWDAVVVKPVFSASAHDTYRITRAEAEPRQDLIDELLRTREIFIQPYMHTIAEEGEWSLLFFNGRFSHALLKRPQEGDFRVQLEYGGSLHALEMPAGLIAQAERVLARVREPWLYARVDGVLEKGQFLLMELEMLEPLLYLATDSGAPARFAEAIIERVDS